MLKRNVTEKPNVNKFKMFQKYLRLPGFRGNLRKKNVIWRKRSHSVFIYDMKYGNQMKT